MRALLSIEAGLGEPRVCELHPAHKVTLGRHRNNLIVLQDEHASRWHAEVFFENGHWFIRDYGALNGTQVDGKAVSGQAELVHGQRIDIGRTCLRFTLEEETNGHAARPVDTAQPNLTPPLPDPTQTVLCMDELTALCRFMATAVRQTDPRILIQHALETVHAQTHATISGFLSLDKDDPLPKLVVPDLACVDVHLSRKLTQEAQRQNRAVWLGAQNDTAPDTESLLSFTDALCVPLVVGQSPLGALHVYRSGKYLTERDVRFCEVLAGHLASSLHLLRVQRALHAENSRLRSHSPAPDQMIGSGPALQKLREQITRLAPRPSTVLIVGESGVGKELVALALHRQSPRHEGPLVSVNCAAIAPSLLESELFGHRKGAFSGADRDHPGLFQQADEGTLFLDEVGELSLECQAKLLRVLEGKGFRPVGATSEIKVDVRILAATHRDLEREVQAKRFRQDLFFRLQGIQIRVPPLREHGEDIPELVEYFLCKLASEWGRPVKITSTALRRLQSYAWPGNVRQLRSLLESAVALSEKETLEPEDLMLPTGSLSAVEPLSLNLEELEAWAIRQALRRTGNNVSKSAALLGVVRDTLASKIKKYGIAREES
jgi:Nif-specific regulatory protein